MRIIVVGCIALALLSTSYTSEAQIPLRDAFATDSTARMYKLAEGVFAITHAAATPDWPHGNTGVVIGNDGVLVIDANYLPDRAELDIALIRRVTNLPVRYLVNTHWHGDHLLTRGRIAEQLGRSEEATTAYARLESQLKSGDADHPLLVESRRGLARLAMTDARPAVTDDPVVWTGPFEKGWRSRTPPTIRSSACSTLSFRRESS